MTPGQANFYRLLRLTLSPAVRDAFQMQVEGLGNIPQRGPALIVCNHRSFVDPFLLAAAVPRSINFLAASFVFKIPGFGALATRTGAIPVDIAGGKKAAPALEQAIGCLAKGQVVGIFPEGVASFKKGSEGIARFNLGFIKALAGARMPELPVIPCAIVGEGERALAELPPALMKLIDRSGQFAGSATELRLPQRVWVSIGKPLLLGQLLGDDPDLATMQAATEAARAQVHQLYERMADHVQTDPKPLVFEIGPVQLRVARPGGAPSTLPEFGQEEALLASYPGTWEPSPQPGGDWLLISDRKLTLWRPPNSGQPLPWDRIAQIRTEHPEGQPGRLLIQERQGPEYSFAPADPDALAAARAAIAQAIKGIHGPDEEDFEDSLWERDRRHPTGEAD
ncbi:MAG: 1-acyl-sn-glycerol-3-phosphate acyltransferase [Candidatus Sericytochromatia bacterium]|nr:1-acyl-sn-glycerol-3-phosphate acyltransferase [Candidatus Sericytochromatia bacterium]